eukprot:Gb_12542 [translate_table: standard]
MFIDRFYQRHVFNFSGLALRRDNKRRAQKWQWQWQWHILLWNGKKKAVLFVEPMLHPLCTEASFTSTTENRALYVKQPNANSCRGDVKTLCEQGRFKEALEILHVLDCQHSRLDFSVYASLLQGCLNHEALSEAKLVHAHMTDNGFKPDVFLATNLMTIYSKCGSLVDARRVLDEMPKRNVVSWNAMIAAYSKHGCAEEALMLFHKMQGKGIQPDQFTFSGILPICANLEALEHGKEIHENIMRSDFQWNIFVGTALLDMYVKCGSIDDARQVFDEMPERNVVSWNAMIAGYAQNGHVDEAVILFQRMPEKNVVSWTAMIAGYAQNGYVDKALELFQKMPVRNEVTWTAILTGYTQGGHVDEALELFQKMHERDVVSWSAMIAGCAQSGRVNEALKLFQQMQLTGVKPNPVTFASILPAFANMADLKHGKEVHKDIIMSGFESNTFVGNALVDMYAKCGSIEYARNVFDKMSRRNVVSWTTMIVGHAIHGDGKKALQLFEQMKRSGIKPNNVTFVGVLSACCHAGLLDDGWHYFHGMSREYHLTPTVEHYCCMVSLLGRAGQLDEAHDFINNMPIKPHTAVWGSLLAACRLHTNIEIGERVAERLFEWEPGNASNYVLLSNIYATTGRWDDAEKVRKLMKDRTVEIMPGCSWIEVNNKVHAFLVGDRSHPQTHTIYAELERLYGVMKEAGYVPDTNFVLHDVEDEQKEHSVCHHSEKLAIAFGLINTSPGTPIRIIKNLRVCGDCHSATKFICDIVAREIVVRDTNRYHHFKGGVCSCGDYW